MIKIWYEVQGYHLLKMTKTDGNTQAEIVGSFKSDYAAEQFKLFLDAQKPLHGRLSIEGKSA